MATFDTPEPISVALEIGVGDIRIAASDRADTVVEVRPSDPAKESDVTAAQLTRVEYANGRLLIKAPKGWKQYTFRGGGESIDVQIDLPTGSDVQGEAGLAALHCTGRLGECRYKTGAGDIDIDQAVPLRLRTGAGDITVDRGLDRGEVTTGSGAIRIAAMEGTAVVKNSNGDTWVGDVTGDLRVTGANGSIAIGRSQAGVVAKTAKGDIRLSNAIAGAVVAETAFGKIDVAIGDGVAAWLDLQTRFGNVHSNLEAAERLEPGEEAVEVRARTSYGDITIARCVASGRRKEEA